MQHNNHAETIRLIAVAQTAARAEEREQAVFDLWKIHGDRLTGIMAKTSYRISSDFSYNGYSPKERQQNLAGDAFMVLYSAIMDFDPDAGVPFAAYIAKKGNWHVLDEKRRNSIRAKYEKPVDFSLESLSASEEPGEDRDLRLLRKATTCGPDFVEEIQEEDDIDKIYRATEQTPKLQRYFVTSRKLVNEGYDYSDAEVARRMGCTRANVGLYKKSLNRLVKEKGILGDSYPPAA